ncbi:MAG: trypsin-like peptidase domain-containing protein [Planctomycetes bacterium]|nr:trypsin-like peptidase domain-containing protein [Planctomycetota bacterium]
MELTIIHDLVRQCTVKLVTQGSTKPLGTGFFVAPGIVLTCAHVIEIVSRSHPISVISSNSSYPALVDQDSLREPPFPDLVLLRIPEKENPCVLLSEPISPGDALFIYGYPLDHPAGDVTTAESEGWTQLEGPQANQRLLKFKYGQIKPGSSGSPILNNRTGCVCGIVKQTRDKQSDLGGRGIPTSSICQSFPTLVSQNREYHAHNRVWIDALKVQSAAAPNRETQPSALPPLKERIPGGAREAVRLLHCLLREDSRRKKYAYVADVDHNLKLDASAPQGGLLDLQGTIGVQFRCEWDESPLSEVAKRQLETSVEVVKNLRKEIQSIVVVSFHELNGADRQWFHTIAKKFSLALYHCGHKHICEWLYNVPCLYARYYPEYARHDPAASGFGGNHSFVSLSEEYRKCVIEAHRNLRLLGLPPRIVQHQEEAGNIPLKRIFTPQSFVSTARTPGTNWLSSASVSDQPPGRDDSHSVLSLADLVSSQKSCVILGDPGAGKSTVLHFISLFNTGDASLSNVFVYNRMPLFISLREFTRRQHQLPGMNLVDYMVDNAHSAFQIQHVHHFFFESLLLMGEAIVLLDGFDETGPPGTREKLARSLEAFQRRYPDCPIWVSSRLYGYAGNTCLSRDLFEHFKVNRFDDQQQQDFIASWYTTQIPNDVGMRNDRIESLKAAVRRTLGVRRLASNPLLLTLIALMHHYRGRLPQTRGELYDESVNMLLEHWEAVKSPDERHPLHERSIYGDDAKTLLAALALWMQRRDEDVPKDDARGLASEGDVFQTLVETRMRQRRDDNLAASREDIQTFLKYIRDRTGLLYYRGEIGGDGVYCFAHLTFQEYLAAYQLSEDRSLSYADHCKFFLDHLGRANWDETLLLLLYRLSKSTGSQSFLDFLVATVVRSKESGITANPNTFSAQTLSVCWLTLGRSLRDDLSFTRRDAREILKGVLADWYLEPQFTVNHFQVVEEIALFSQRWREVLAELLKAEYCQAPPENAVASFHLFARLFGLTDAAVVNLGQRQDISKCSLDLVAFQQHPVMTGWLDQLTTFDQWFTAFHFLEGRNLYLLSLEWAKERCDLNLAANRMLSALAWIFGKIRSELTSRTQFAVKYCAPNVANRVARLALSTDHYWISTPLACTRVHPAEIRLSKSIVAVASPLRASLMAEEFSRSAAHKQSYAALASWITGALTKHIQVCCAVNVELEADLAALGEEFAPALSSLDDLSALYRYCFDGGEVAPLEGEAAALLYSSGLSSHSRRRIREYLLTKIGRTGGAELGRLEEYRKMHDWIGTFRGARAELGDIELEEYLVMHDWIRAFDATAELKGFNDVLAETKQQTTLYRDTVRSSPATLYDGYFRPTVVGAFWMAVQNCLRNGFASVFLGKFLDKCRWHIPRIFRRQLELSFCYISLPFPITGCSISSALNAKSIAVQFIAEEEKGQSRTSTIPIVTQVENPLFLPAVLLSIVSLGVYNHMFQLCRHLALMAERDINTWQKWTARYPFDVYSVALAWEEHVKQYQRVWDRLDGLPGALLLAHGALCNLMTGMLTPSPQWSQMIAERNQSDPLVEVAHLFYELCGFENQNTVRQKVNTFLEAVPDRCRGILEAAEWLHNGRPTIHFLGD